MTGWFYFQALALFACAIPMAIYPDAAHLIFGVVAGACFFMPGLQYYRQKLRVQREREATLRRATISAE